MDYKSTLEGLQGFYIASAGFSEHQVGAWTIPDTLVKVRGSWKFLIVVSKLGAVFTLRQFLSMRYRLST